MSEAGLLLLFLPIFFLLIFSLPRIWQRYCPGAAWAQMAQIWRGQGEGGIQKGVKRMRGWEIIHSNSA